ncbi:hypothetical protein, partial [Paenibacillus tyrfis]|uniref:hypothetical protein n=1 Tax=Paenibacillus tyrfis TaxID=1501230 RepID=UPI00209F73A2
MIRKNLLMLMILMLELVLLGCNTEVQSVENKKDYYGVSREADGYYYISSLTTGLKKNKLDGRTSFILYDKKGLLWVPYEREYDYKVGSKVDIYKDEKIVRTISVENRPVKIIEGNVMNAVICEVNGEKGRVVFVNNSTFEVIKTVEIEGNPTDAIFDEGALFVTSDNLVKNVDSFVHKINVRDYSINTTIIKDSRRINSIQEYKDFIYVGVLSYDKKEYTNLVKLKKADLTVEKEIKVEFSPLEIKKQGDKLYLLHFSYNTDPVWGGVMTIFDLQNETTREVDIPITANHIFLDSGKILFSSSYSEQYVEYSLENNSLKEHTSAK